MLSTLDRDKSKRSLSSGSAGTVTGDHLTIASGKDRQGTVEPEADQVDLSLANLLGMLNKGYSNRAARDNGKTGRSSRQERPGGYLQAGEDRVDSCG